MGALTGIRILDLSRVLAGPFCTQMLADLGAEVCKVESPAGDDTRRWGPPFRDGESAYFLSANRGKRSVAINLKDPRGAALVRELAQHADVLVENFKCGDMQRFGLDYDTLRRDNPRLVYASITGFGQTGPRAHQPGYDVVLQALTGIMSVTGEPDGAPMKVGAAWIDVLSGMMAAIGILAALRERDASGEGQHIDLGLYDVGVMAMVNQAQAFLMSGEVPRRLGNAHPQIVPYQTFRAADGWFMLAVGNDGQYRHLTEALEAPELWADARWQTNAGRVESRAELTRHLAEIFPKQSRDFWLDRLQSAGVPCAPIADVGEAFTDAQAGARNLQWHVQHPALGELPLVANALQHMSRTPAEPRGAPPLLGQHTTSVLTEWLALDADELAELERDGIVFDTSSQRFR